MYVYKDYNYINYVCSLDLTSGLAIYTKCLSRLQEHKEELLDDRLWDIYKNRDETLKDQTFEEFKNSMIKPNNIKQTRLNKDIEEDRILKESMKLVDLDKKRLECKDVQKPKRKRVTRIITK